MYERRMNMNENKKRSLLPAILITAALTALVTLLLTLFFVIRAQRKADNSYDSYADKIKEIQNYIDDYFIGEVDDKKMGDEIAAGMIKGLDDEWSYYIPKESYESYRENVENAYVGIGVTITEEGAEKGLRITEVTPGSPAEQAGLLPEDLILAVEGTPVLDGSEGALDLNETKNRVRGEAGTKVVLTIQRGNEIQDYTLTRAAIKTVNVTSAMLEGDLVYIRIRNFERNAAQDTIAAVEAAMTQNAKGIIFDVRYNPGGLKQELVELLDYLLPEGALFRSVDYTGVEKVDYSDAAHIEIPMAVLANYNSYSAAEFFAAALQEYEAAQIVGEQTYGKGYFQTAFTLKDGSAINISIGKYTTPKGVSLVGKGVTPDIPVELSDSDKSAFYYGKLAAEDDEQLQAAIRALDPNRAPTPASSTEPDTEPSSEAPSEPAPETELPSDTEPPASSEPVPEPSSEPDTEPEETPGLSYPDKLKEIQEYLDRYFVGDMDDKKLADAVAEALIDGLGDEWSYYLPEESYSSYVESVTNSYVGIGVTITSEGVEKGLLITDVTPESPAYYAGLQIGDLMVAVEGVRILDGSDESIDIQETKNRVRGEENTDVTITILRDGVETDYTITRAAINVVVVSSEQLEDGLVYIKIRNFDENAARDAKAAVNEALEQNAKGIIFDVRYNPGGYKYELVELLDFLLPEGPLFRAVDYNGRERVDYSDANHVEIPMVVLVNYDSYSAAEFFAAALQEYGAAQIVGEQTYGKGRFQQFFLLSDGSGINISTGTYTTPNGNNLVGVGVTPDYVVELSDEEKMDLYYGRLEKDADEQLKTAISILNP